MLWMRRFGVALGALVLTVWLGTWLYLGGAVQGVADWGHEKTVRISADAGFTVRNILVEGRVFTDPQVLLGMLNVQKGDPLLGFNPHGAKVLLEQVSWVKTAKVERRFPDTIYVELVERQPLALWQNEQKLYLIDAQGVVLTDHGLRRFSDLVMVSGEGSKERAAELIANLNAEPRIRPLIDTAQWVGERRWNLKTKGGIEIKLPAEDVGLALGRLVKMDEEEGILQKNLEHIDLRKTDRIIVQTAPGMVQEFSIENFLKARFSDGDDI